MNHKLISILLSPKAPTLDVAYEALGVLPGLANSNSLATSELEN